jgi:hypothetical protein
MKSEIAFKQAETDKVIHGYNQYYDKIFENFTPNTLLEIGVKEGNSLAAWKMIFPDCQLFGIDITDRNFNDKLISFSEAKITIANSTKLSPIQKYDIIIDDGSHYYKDIARTFKLFHNNFNRYYVIEDYFYDIDMARKFLNKNGYTKINIFPSIHIKNYKVDKHVLITEMVKTNKTIRVDGHMIVVER